MAKGAEKKPANGLDAYRAKRDFSNTPEPRGTKPIAAAPYPRFVIQKHDATRLHYDLRLEVDGVFKSWAVTRGPSLDPSEKRLAVETEDHPLDYGDFEGTIPEGYGEGTVMLWDRGYWTPTSDKPVAEALRAGELKFTAGGEKFRGDWVIVKIKNDKIGGKKTNWLLIKHRDEWAKSGDAENLLQQDRSIASGRTMAEIAAGKGKGPTPFMVAGAATLPADAVLGDDKPADVVKARRASARIVPVSAAGHRVLGIVISKPEKVLWPQGARAAVTKIKLAEYLGTVGPWMLQHIAGRPCSLLRAPDGITGQSFFQRHAASGTTDRLTKVEVEGDSEAYVQIDTLEGLVSMAQIAALEIHPWNSAPNEPTVPGRLVFDLDPAPDVPFKLVVAAALELRERIERVGLVAFCKTTGGKGLHVVTPLKRDPGDGLGWPEAKTFAHTISAQMAEDTPQRYLTNISKRRRTGRILLDYLRNDRLATAVAPLSPRARPGATVSMPVDWDQVKPGLDPTDYTIHTAPGLLAQSKAWADYARSARTLESAIKRLIKSA